MEISVPSERFRRPRPARAVHFRRPSGAYSLIEMLIALLIIQIIASFVVVSIQSINGNSHMDQINKRVTGLLRYARMLAMSSGQPCNVDFSVANQTIKVYLGASTTPASNAMFPGGQCVINLNSDQGIAGVTITGLSTCAAVTVSGATVYRCTYGALGTRTSAPTFSLPMTVSFKYGKETSTLTVPNVGDPI